MRVSRAGCPLAGACRRGHPPPTDRTPISNSRREGGRTQSSNAKAWKPLALCRDVGCLFSLGRGELELLGELLPDIIVVATELPDPARDVVASLASTRGREEESDGCSQYRADRNARRKQTDIVPIRNGFVR